VENIKSYISNNLKYLRERKSKSQEDTASALGLKRGRYASYEEGRNEPNIETLIRISRYYKIQIDILVSRNMSSKKQW
jgi:transcriptional regulator with XRE-family HTH domain